MFHEGKLLFDIKEAASPPDNIKAHKSALYFKSHLCIYYWGCWRVKGCVTASGWIKGESSEQEVHFSPSRWFSYTNWFSHPSLDLIKWNNIILMFGCNILTLSFLAVSWEQKQSFHRSYLMSGFHLWSFLWNVFYFNRIVLLPSINNTIITDFSTSSEVCADFLVLFL